MPQLQLMLPLATVEGMVLLMVLALIRDSIPVATVLLPALHLQHRVATPGLVGTIHGPFPALIANAPARATTMLLWLALHPAPLPQPRHLHPPVMKPAAALALTRHRTRAGVMD